MLKPVATITYTDFSINAGVDGKEIVTDADVIKQEIMHVLATSKGSRLGRKHFGCYIRKFLFDPLSVGIANKIRTEIRMSLNHPENKINGVTLGKVEVIPDFDNSLYYVNIRFKDMNNYNSNVEFNLLKEAA